MSERKFYSDREKKLLIHLVDNHKIVIECKKTDGVNIRKKQQAWPNKETLFNANDVTKRNEKQLKKLWDNIKQKTRRSDTEKKRHLFATGGGPPLVEDADPIDERVRSIVPTINYEIDNEFDSVYVFQNDKVSLKNMTSGSWKNETEPEQMVVEEIIIEDIGKEYKENISPILTPYRPLVGAKKKCVPKLKGTKRKIFDEEAELRRQKVRESIQQQSELHEAKLEAVKEEKKYWSLRITQLNKNCSYNF